MYPKLAFPHVGNQSTLSQPQDGMELRDWFATFAPEPSSKYITQQMESDRAANPHNDYHKTKRRSRLEIIADAKYAYADAMMARREVKHA